MNRTLHEFTWQGVRIESTVPEEVFKKLAFAALRNHECFPVLHEWWKEECRKQGLVEVNK